MPAALPREMVALNDHFEALASQIVRVGLHRGSVQQSPLAVDAHWRAWIGSKQEWVLNQSDGTSLS